MKITDVETILLSLPDIAWRTDGSQDTAVVKVTTDEGIVGIGEVDSSPRVVKAIIEAPKSHTLCRGLRDIVIGQDPFNIRQIWDKMYEGSLYYGRRGAVIHAMSGIDIALWDILGKATGKPVHTLLGGNCCQNIRAYASSLFGDTVSETGDMARRYADMGFTAVKFGWEPLGSDPDNDVALVREIRRAVGTDRDVIIDAGLVWDAKTAIMMARRFADYDIYWLEEPLHPDDLDGYARLTGATEVRIAAGEEESERHSFIELMDRGGIDVVQVDVTRCGGLTEALRIAGLARDRRRPVVNHSFKTGINIAASLHFLAAIPNSFIFEYCVSQSPLRHTLTKQRFEVVDGRVSVPQEPGLGIELDETVIAQYRVA
ncbi:mandelate racemase/muconate lactonizing enzyme family protein [bacterium]|nr:mandelate racemase/muconate lactonizing enzyme family protein [bacterium]